MNNLEEKEKNLQNVMEGLIGKKSVYLRLYLHQLYRPSI